VRAAAPLSPEARALLERTWEGLDPARVVDAHVHLVGLGQGASGCYVNPRMRSIWSLRRFIRYRLYLRAGGVRDEERGDAQYLDSLVRLASAPPHGKIVLLALDAAHGVDGRPDLEATEFATPDAWVFAAVRLRPDLFLPGISVHPYRADALDRLEEGASRGAVLVKWLPSEQRIDPASPRCDAFYRKLAALRLPLLAHAGEEQAVEGGVQHLGNPLRLRRPLDAGVRVIAAHCASLGEDKDLDAPGRPMVPSFRLFLRLMREERYRDRLLGDLSGLTHYNRCRWLPELLASSDLHPRLVNGSDYPLPAVDVVVRLGRLVEAGVLDPELLPPLRELWGENVLRFDLALKRSLSWRGARLPAGCFMPALLAGR
jgi:mannonate dehydratase